MSTEPLTTLGLEDEDLFSTPQSKVKVKSIPAKVEVILGGDTLANEKLVDEKEADKPTLRIEGSSPTFAPVRLSDHPSPAPSDGERVSLSGTLSPQAGDEYAEDENPCRHAHLNPQLQLSGQQASRPSTTEPTNSQTQPSGTCAN